MKAWVITVEYDTGSVEREIFINFPISYITTHASDCTKVIVEHKTLNEDDQVYSILSPDDDPRYFMENEAQ